MSIAIEAVELMEIFQWDNTLPADRYDEATRERVSEELGDVLLYTLSLTREFDIDIVQSAMKKLEANEDRFDEETAAEINSRLERFQR